MVQTKSLVTAKKQEVWTELYSFTKTSHLSGSATRTINNKTHTGLFS